MKKYNKIIGSFLIIGSLFINSCSKLNSLDEVTTDNRNIITSTSSSNSFDIKSAYKGLNSLTTQGNWFAFQEHSTDELLGPTRGTDWDDYGTWRKIHLHTWDIQHNQLLDTWNAINGASYQATLVIELADKNYNDKNADIKKPEYAGLNGNQAIAEAKFLRAYFNYLVMDLYGQVPYRSATAPINTFPTVYTREKAFDIIVKDLTEAIPDLQSYSSELKHRATKETAAFLLAKLYLNKAVYKQNPNSPAGPYTFAASDMNLVIALVDTIIGSGQFNITPNYWDNFKWDNFTASKEIIFGRGCNGTPDGNQLGGKIDVQWATAMGSHYNDWYGGWNGFTTTSDFYNSFGSTDKRRGDTLAGSDNYQKTGMVAGFRIGQQFKSDGSKLVQVKDRSGSPLIFTPDVNLFYSTESKGIRTNKYPLKSDARQSWGESNTFVFFRFSDLLLMKAEAILRGGTATKGQTPLLIISALRQRAGASPISTVTLNDIIAERGRELFLEGWRRNDLIRFGKFNEPVIERKTASEPYKVVLPIPAVALSSNPNLTQNFGY